MDYKIMTWKKNINNINNIINNNNIININNNVINQNNNILNYFDIDNNNIINNNLFKRFIEKLYIKK